MRFVYGEACGNPALQASYGGAFHRATGHFCDGHIVLDLIGTPQL
jgi:hypothetical protein